MHNNVLNMKIKHRLKLYLFVLGFIWMSAGIAVAMDECGDEKWQCDNGECIKSEEMCDGQANCADKSDETANYCLNTACPTYAFRCAYGACIIGYQVCDGYKQCIDGSDETKFRCADDAFALEKNLTGSCSVGLQTQCLSGECIDSDKRCDGIADCRDGSDETVEMCSHIYCPTYAFRCAYGSCIRGSALCNGIQDCADGSDELPDVCEPKAMLTPQNGAHTPKKGCKIPFDRKYLLVQQQSNKEWLRLGTKVPSSTRIRFSCGLDTVLEGVADGVCMDENWLDVVPHCAKYCPQSTLQRGISTTVNCFYQDKLVNCSSNLRIGTRVYITCAPGYKSTPVKEEWITCDHDSEWNYPKSKCQPDCVADVVKTDQTLRPWDVTVYKLLGKDSAQAFGGGAIISPKLIMFGLDQSSLDVYNDKVPPVDYIVLLGKQQTTIDDSYMRDRQLHFVSEIMRPNINDVMLLSNKEAEIRASTFALLVLKNYMVFGDGIRPICLNFESDDAARHVVIDGDTGYAHFSRELITKRTANRIDVYKYFIKRKINVYQYLL